MFNEKLSLFHARAANAGEAIHLGSQLLLDAGAVKEDFESHVLAREEEFPTGLAAEPVGAAIPHTDSAYVNWSQIAFVSLDEPVDFRFMADRDQIVRVGLVFVIAMAHAHEQVDTLSALMGLLSEPDAVEDLMACSSPNELSAILARYDLS